MPRYKLAPIQDEERQRYKVEIPASISPSGKRTRRFFNQHWQALKYAKSVREQLAQFGLSLKLLSPQDTVDAMEALRLLANHAIQTEDWQTLTGLAKAHIEKWHLRHKSVSLEELFKRYLEANGKRISAKHLRNITYTRRQFEPLAQVPVSEINQMDLDRFLRGCTDSLHNAHLRNVSAVLGLGQRKGFLPENVARRVDVRHIERGEITLLPNSTIRALFEYAAANQPKLLAFLTLAVFCGVRTERELPRLEWRDIDLDHRQIVCIRPLNAKNRTRRYIPLAPNAVAWLRYYLDTVMQGRQPEPQERVLAILSPEGLRKARRRVWRGIGQQPSRTAGSILRHVFASNHLAFHNDIDRLCSEMEHRSPDTLFRHYANGVTSDAAAEFWRISPQELASHKARAAAFDAVSIDDSAR